jgi:hypothetical protein
MDYFNKYLEYKNKYLTLKLNNQIGSGKKKKVSKLTILFGSRMIKN